MNERLYRSNNERMLLGVCGGISERMDLDPTLVRLAFVALAFMGPGLLAYLIAALVIPLAPSAALSAHVRAQDPSRPAARS